MTLLALLVCLAGGFGAATRLVLDGLIRHGLRSTYPIGTTVINVSGSLLLGLVTGLATGHVLPHAWSLVAGTGFLGGYTTFSTASFETVRLIEDRRHAAAILNGIGLLVVGTAAAGAGFALGVAW